MKYGNLMSESREKIGKEFVMLLVLVINGLKLNVF